MSYIRFAKRRCIDCKKGLRRGERERCSECKMVLEIYGLVGEVVSQLGRGDAA